MAFARSAARPAHNAMSADIDQNPSENFDPALIGMVVAAEALMRSQQTVGSSAYDVYEAVVITSEDPEGFVNEADVLRSLQAIENGETPEFEGELHELAIRLRQALDAGIDPDTDIRAALELPEAAFAPAITPEQAVEIQQRLAEFYENHDQSGHVNDSVAQITPAP